MDEIIKMLTVNVDLAREGISSNLSFTYDEGLWTCEYFDGSSFSFSAVWSSDTWEGLVAAIKSEPEGNISES